jgi:hypothetical protein
MNKLSIDKNVPLPKTICGRTPEEHSYPFEKMQKGDSFFVKGNNERNYYTGYNELYAHIYNRMYDYRKSINKSKSFVETVQFTIRAVEGGYRCWRTR